MNAAPVIAAALAFDSVIVSTAVALGAISDGLIALATVGWINTVNVADAELAVPALVVVMLPVELAYEPAVADVTFTVTVHEPLAGTVAPESATLPPPFAAVTVAPPPQVVAPLALAVLTRFAGYVSVNAAPVTAVAFALVSVMVSTLVSFVPIELAEKDFAAVSGESTVNVADAAAVFEPALPEVTAPAPMVLA